MANERIKLQVWGRQAKVEANRIARRGRVRLGQTRLKLRGLVPKSKAYRSSGLSTAADDGGGGVRHFPATVTPDEVAAELARSGALIIDNLVEPEVMDRVVEEMSPHIEATSAGGNDFRGRNTRRTGALIARSATARELVQHPTILGTADIVLSHSPTYQINLTQIISVGSGEPAQKIHRDHWTFGDFPFPEGQDVQCSTIWALDDFTDENGATRLVPGSNHAGNRINFAQRDSIPAAMNKGSVLVYTGSVYHGGGSNTTTETRRGLNLTYIVGWLRQEENQYLATPPEVARTLPPDLLRLMGYQECGAALGYVDDCRDPLDVLLASAD
jgi:ectoine hydroxylase-related dioxygenase (phytanoyl-CoA dioxygenase family)